MRTKRQERTKRQGVLFDERPVEPALSFYSVATARTLPVTTLGWARAALPAEIEKVSRFVASRRLAIETIVIGGLSEYPISEEFWPAWLALMGCGPGPTRLVVDTGDLSLSRRRRLIEGTRRQERLLRRADPLAGILAKFNVLTNWSVR